MINKKTYGVLVLSVALAATVTTTGCAKRQDGVKTNNYRSTETRTLNDNFRTRTYDGSAYDGKMNYGRTYDGRAYDVRTNDGTGTGFHGTAYDGTTRMNDGTTNWGHNVREADKIADRASSVKGVSKANVIVHGKDAVVGVDVKSGRNTAAVAREVKRTLEKHNTGYKYHVTADKKFNTRILELRNGMGTGTSTDGMTDGMGTRGSLTDGMRTRSTTDGITNRGTTNDGMRSLDGRPIRNFAYDIGVLIEDIGRTVTAPFR